MSEVTSNIAGLNTYQRDLMAAGYRGLVVISGSQKWTHAQVCKALRSGVDSLWVGENACRDDIPTIKASECIQHLGREHSDVVFDCWHGLDPDALGAISGTLRSGSILYLLTPEFSAWESFDDPEYQRIIVEPYQSKDAGRRFLRHVIHVINSSDEIQIWNENGSSLRQQIRTDINYVSEDVAEPYKTRDQLLAVRAIDKLIHGHRNRPLLIVADRGRGKSSALGLAATNYMSKGRGKIGVTAPNRKQADEIFRRIKENYPQAIIKGSKLLVADSVIEFYAPDALLETVPELNLLLVDEAAAIPLSMLEKMLLNHSRVVYSTTVHGYEGTGKGFENKFQQLLDNHCSNWHKMYLDAPIRWSKGDVLERIINNILLLDAENSNTGLVFSKPELKIQSVYRNKFIESDKDLHDWFGLLVNAHYKTRPYDLRQILDGPNIGIWTATVRGKIIATAVVAMEGVELDAEKVNSIHQGKHRLHGHLMPQSLSVHAGCKAALEYKYVRIVRVAVVDEYRRKGIGQLLVETIQQWAEENTRDYLAVSYGADRELLNFWSATGFISIRMGSKKEASTGQHNLMMLKALNSRAEGQLHELQSKFYKDLPYLLSESLHLVDVRYIIEMVKHIEIVELDEDVAKAVHVFCSGNRLFDSSLRELNLLLENRLFYTTVKQDEVYKWALRFLMERVWQRRDRNYFLKEYGIDSKALMLEEIKRAAAILLNQV